MQTASYLTSCLTSWSRELPTSLELTSGSESLKGRPFAGASAFQGPTMTCVKKRGTVEGHGRLTELYTVIIAILYVALTLKDDSAPVLEISIEFCVF
jgi:hypothetical protein